MPLVQIQMIEGRTEDQKREVIKSVSEALVKSTGSPIEAVRVIIQEVPSTNWGKNGLPAKDFGR